MKKIKYFAFAFVLAFSFVQAQQQQHSLFTEILKEYVSDGKVNYKELKDDSRLPAYIEQLSKTNPDTISNRDDALAFWLNVYNAFTLKVICENYPVESINDLHSGGLVIGMVLGTTIWHKDFVIINNEELSLEEVEHDIIRPEFNDARIHFAVVCASISCPALRPEAYEGYKLDAQLDEEGRRFLADETKNRFDKENKTAYLSKIFSWFDDDFGDNDNEILSFITNFLPKTADGKKPDLTDWDIDHLDYDWGLNE